MLKKATFMTLQINLPGQKAKPISARILRALKNGLGHPVGKRLTCRANKAKTIKQNIVKVITSANCLTALSRALIIIFRPENMKKELNFLDQKLFSKSNLL